MELGNVIVNLTALLQVGSAFLFVAGYVGANASTEFARRTEDPAALAVLIALMVLRPG